MKLPKPVNLHIWELISLTSVIPFHLPNPLILFVPSPPSCNLTFTGVLVVLHPVFAGIAIFSHSSTLLDVAYIFVWEYRHIYIFFYAPVYMHVSCIRKTIHLSAC